MEKYDFKKIESKWQKRWLADKVFKANDSSKKQKYYQLETFPYPSAAGLHVGHPKGYIAEDIHARYKRMKGYEVLYTMGWDAFGLPTENYAIQVGKSPKEVAEANVKNFKRQVQMFGLSYDWDREINTSHPNYYKWTQWLFIKLYEKGLAYRAKAKVNWCPKDQTVLANEQVVDGKCERCGSVIEQRKMEQWFFKITDYAERLLGDLKGLDWPASTIKRQEDWIGKSEGALLDFEMGGAVAPSYVLLHGYTGSPKANFFPWLKKELERRGAKVYAPELPDTDDPKAYDQVAAVLRSVPFDKDTVLVGHSLGGVVAMKVLEQLKQPVKKTVLVASFTQNRFLDEPFRDHAFDWKFDVEKIKNNAGSIHILRDTTDDTVPQYQADNVKDLLDGTIFDFAANEPHVCGEKEPEVLRHCIDAIRVFTTRPDTLFGATYMVLAPEHSLVSSIKGQASNWKEVEAYVEKAKHKTELQRQEEVKEKTGVELKGVKAINPATKEEIPIWVADYVLMGYGTGAIMAVPAHDERDFEFAKKFELPIRHVVIPERIDHKNPHVPGKEIVFRKVILGIVRNSKTGKYLCLNWKKQPWTTFVIGGVEEGEDPVEAAKREIMEETGYKNIKFLRILGGPVQSKFFAAHKDVNRIARTWSVLFELENDEHEKVSREEAEIHEIVWLDPSEITRERMAHAELDIVMDRISNGEKAYTGEGILINSGKFDGMDSEKAKWEITKSVGGTKKVQYKIRDWSVSRQRYWGVPIPIIYCSRCLEIRNPKSEIRNKSQIQNLKFQTATIDGKEYVIHPVPEKDLPVLLPDLENYRPKGKPPLASSEKFIKVKCPKCGGEAKRDPETLDAFVDSSWYYLAYAMQGISPPKADPPRADNFPSSAMASAGMQFPITNYKKAINHWLPVDLYVIGAEHTVLHLLYSRFITKFLHDEGFLKFTEPFLKLRHQGLVLGEGGQKMSKSKGNVVNPDDVVGEFGADVTRLYMMFMGPFEEGAPWDPKGILGAERFLNRVWKLITDNKRQTTNDSDAVTRLVHKTIKKVGEDINNLKFNTAVSALMILLNAVEKESQLSVVSCELFVKIIHPFAPHMAQELWSELGHDSILDFEKWPEFDSKLVQDETFTLVIQINGRVRDSVEVPVSITESEAKELALKREKVKSFIGSSKPQKVIYVSEKLVSIVI